MSNGPQWLLQGKDVSSANFAGRGRFLYQPPEPVHRADDTIRQLSEKAGESLVSWKARIEGRVLQLNAAARGEAVSLLTPAAKPYSNRNAFNKFSGLSNKAVKRLGLLDVGRCIEYQHALSLHELWLKYMEDVIGSERAPQQVARILALSDLNGAIIKIVESTCPSYVGISGIILRETHHTLSIVTEDNVVRLVLKNGSVFSIEWNNWSFYIHGVHLAATPSQRSKSKLKHKLYL
ncbi:ribonuclease P/MRP subunit Rpp29 like protein [Babesia gibsoni]|uniref:Ribonuclease P/MRP subunit Rpp29 like protein n=1 Tax=Babesia gibsoni TaxID=33632 RepID=A0AAD8PDR0_BABGI|nr:ribonuclease P/MRP subunit Rpp29 like protein [Babesia gibsoni]